MSKKKMKFFMGGVLILGLIAYLAYAGLKDTMMYYFTVSELLSRGDSIYGAGVRLGGKVADGTVEWNPKTLQLKFVIGDGAKRLPVQYQGVVPDIFKEGIDVVVEGKYNSDGVFYAKTLLAKCPSKFEGKVDELAAKKAL